MRAVVQRVKSAKVTVNGEITGQIETGLLVYLGVSPDDNEFDIVMAFMVMYQVPQWLKVMHEMRRVVKPDGYVIIGDFFYSGLSKSINKMLKRGSGFTTFKELDCFVNEVGFAAVQRTIDHPC